ncbi:alcohol dehydrogenase catalytic domain-containing protein [Thermogymnomonas acidicola]|uniref:alcohol dehydrogenase catalytic domain-containing protein n=1 Tax=Thermogymnomonas acidicola TaxID=399579 RepID=UPI00094673D8|nr:alcohol dehydrogenase catalytic domain-containing protein [Thermogymnomonas acidicola]
MLIRVVGAGICHSDVHVWEGVWSSTGGAPRRLPHIQSHEIAGVVERVGGERVPDAFREGTGVLVYAWQWEHDDMFTAEGLTNLSDSPPLSQASTRTGGFQEYYLVPPHYRYLINASGISDLAAAAPPLTCGGLTTYRAVRKAAPYVRPDDYVAVIGLGGLGGAYAAQYIRKFCPQANLIGIDMKESAVDFVSSITPPLDSHIVPPHDGDVLSSIRAETHGSGLRAVIDLVGSGTLSTYIRALAKGGIYVLVGLMGSGKTDTISPPGSTVLLERNISGSYVGGTLAEQHEVVALARKGVIDYRKPVTARMPLDDAYAGLQALHSGQVLGRQVVTP